MSQAGTDGANLERLLELLGPVVVSRLRQNLEDGCSESGEAWITVEIRCKAGMVQHADVMARRRISPIDKKPRDPRGHHRAGE